MDRYRYPTTALASDYLRVVLGLAATAGPLVALDLAGAVRVLLSGLVLVFGWFGVRTVLRQLSWVELSARDLALCGPLERRLVWQRLERLKLAYYAPRRARQDGWLQLTLQGDRGRPIRLDSTLSGFDDILRRAVSVARLKQLILDPTTQANLAALGLGAGPEPEAAADRTAVRPARLAQR
jgi:hypothetical protein